jgi:hypothetical protein
MESLRENKEGSDALLMDFRESLDAALDRLRALLEDPPDSPPSWRYRAFTDNIVLGFPMRSPDGEGELGSAAVAISEFILALASRGWCVRGGIAFGNMYIDDDIVFGPALLDAYSTEKEIARDPRVAVHQSCRSLIEMHLSYYGDPFTSPHNGYFAIDSDEVLFVNYLYGIKGLEYSEDEMIEAMTSHAKKTKNSLVEFKDTPTVWSKYSWIARYHNWFATTWNLPARLLIPRGEFEQTPRLLVSGPRPSKSAKRRGG